MAASSQPAGADGGDDPFSVERIARLICEASGQNPDQCVHGPGTMAFGGDGKQAYAESKCYRRAWEKHISPANAVIARYAALASTARAGAGDLPDAVREAVQKLDAVREEEHQRLAAGEGMRLYRMAPLEHHANGLCLDYVRSLLSAVPASPISTGEEGLAEELLAALRKASDLVSGSDRTRFWIKVCFDGLDPAHIALSLISQIVEASPPAPAEHGVSASPRSDESEV